VQPNLTHECVLVLLKLSSNVNECKPLPTALAPAARSSACCTSAPVVYRRNLILKAEMKAVHHVLVSSA